MKDPAACAAELSKSRLTSACQQFTLPAVMADTDQLTLNFSRGELARDLGIERAIRGTGGGWFDIAMPDLVAFLREHGEAPIEQWRMDWISRKKSLPASHKAYGALARMAAAKGVIKATGRYVRAASERTHGHPVMVWRAV